MSDAVERWLEDVSKNPKIEYLDIALNMLKEAYATPYGGKYDFESVLERCAYNQGVSEVKARIGQSLRMSL